MNERRGSSQPIITRTQSLGQIHAIANSVSGAVKNASDAKGHLCAKGWIAPGETITQEVLARVLFATIVNATKLPQVVTADVTSVAYLLTEQMEEGILDKLANDISFHIKETPDSLTSDLHVKLGQHIQSANEAAQVQTSLTDKLIQAQEKMDETTLKAMTTTRTYSQVAATAPTYTPAPPPPVSIDQVRLQNREEIKKRQVLIEFDGSQDLQLENMDETVLARKVKDAINTTWAASTAPKPDIPQIKAAVLMRNGGLLLELDRAEAAEWLCSDDNRSNVLANIGSGASIKNRTYQVIVQFIPVQFKPEDKDALRQVEATNNLQTDSILKAEWIKPVKDRRENQRVATARFYFKDAKSANTTLSKDTYILGKKVIPKKPRREPIRCLKCQLFGHERRHCTSEEARCAKCAMNHETEDCQAPLRAITCRNCEGRHPSYDRDCPRFVEKCAQLDARCPENNLAFYPTDEPWSWATLQVNHNQDLRFEERNTTQHQGRNDGFHPGFRSGANTTPIGPHRPPRSQPNLDTSQ